VTSHVNPQGDGVVRVATVPDICLAEAAGPATVDLRDHFDDIGTDGTLVRPFTSDIYAKAYIFDHANADSQHIKQPWAAGRMSGFPAWKTRIQVTVIPNRAPCRHRAQVRV
jgi:hypothetical protein